MALDNVFIWIGVLGIGTILAGITAKYFGGETVWNFFKSIFDTIVQVFRSIIDMAPGWLKIVMFLALFALLNQAIINLTFGFAFYCHEGDVYNIEPIDALGLRFFSSVNKLDVRFNDVDYWIKNDVNELGLVFPTRPDTHPEKVTLNSQIDGFLTDKGLFLTGEVSNFEMVICYDSNNISYYGDTVYGGSCYLTIDECEANGAASFLGFDVDDKIGEIIYSESDGVVQVYLTKRPINDKLSDVAGYSLTSRCDQSVYQDINNDTSLYLCVKNQHQSDEIIGDELDCGYVGLSRFWTEQEVFDYESESIFGNKDSVIKSISTTTKGVDLKNQAVSLLGNDTYKSETGDIIEYSCVNDEDLRVAIFGLPVFEPWFVFVIVFIGALLYISNWMRGY